jgi:hypothetical protein
MEIDLAAARQFALEGFAQLHVVPWHDEGLHGKPMRGRGGNDGEIAQAGHCHVQRAWNGCRGQRQQVHVGAQCLQCFFLADSEALLLIDDDQSKIRETYVLLQQSMRADDDVQRAVGDPADLGLDFLRGFESRQYLDADGPIGEAIAEIAVMLFGQQGGGHQHGDLLAGDGRNEGGAHGDFGLAEADVAAHHQVHRL